jgi:hypothetical protein
MKTALALTFSSLLFLACKTTQSQSVVKHNLGDVSWSDGKWTYLDLDRTTFIKMNNSNYLPEGHELSLKASEWVDRLHAAVVRKHPNKMSGIPKPEVIVMKKNSADAFAAKRRTVSYKLDVLASNVSSESNELKETKALYFNDSTKKLAHNIFPTDTTIAITNPSGYQTWFSKIHAPCSMEETGREDIKWAYSSSCELESYLKPNHWSSEFITTAAPNWIIVTSGLFSVLPNEESFAAVIAHELAHYYRAHVVKDMKHYNHCYMLTDPNHRPVERQELKTLCRDLQIGRSRAGIDPAKAAAQIGLGVYTIEEEADELALEILSITGIQPIKAVDAWFALFEHSGTEEKPMEIPFAKCKQLFSNNWLDELGQAVAVPLGNYQNTHHSWCFRVFNTTNEIKTHNYQVTNPLSLNQDAWDGIRIVGSNP